MKIQWNVSRAEHMLQRMERVLGLYAVTVEAYSSGWCAEGVTASQIGQWT